MFRLRVQIQVRVELPDVLEQARVAGCPDPQLLEYCHPLRVLPRLQQTLYIEQLDGRMPRGALPGLAGAVEGLPGIPLLLLE